MKLAYLRSALEHGQSHSMFFSIGDMLETSAADDLATSFEPAESGGGTSRHFARKDGCLVFKYITY